MVGAKCSDGIMVEISRHRSPSFPLRQSIATHTEVAMKRYKGRTDSIRARTAIIRSR
jgi:hypothetical protein